MAISYDIEHEMRELMRNLREDRKTKYEERQSKQEKTTITIRKPLNVPEHTCKFCCVNICKGKYEIYGVIKEYLGCQSCIILHDLNYNVHDDEWDLCPKCLEKERVDTRNQDYPWHDNHRGRESKEYDICEDCLGKLEIEGTLYDDNMVEISDDYPEEGVYVQPLNGVTVPIYNDLTDFYITDAPMYKRIGG